MCWWLPQRLIMFQCMVRQLVAHVRGAGFNSVLFTSGIYLIIPFNAYYCMYNVRNTTDVIKLCMQCISTNSDNCYRCVADSDQNCTKIHFFEVHEQMLPFFLFTPLEVHLLSKSVLLSLQKLVTFPSLSYL